MFFKRELLIEIAYNMTWSIEPINGRFLRKARIVQFLPVQIRVDTEENRQNIILRSGIDFLWLNICLLSLIFMLPNLSYFI